MKRKQERPKKQPLTTRGGKTRSVAASFEPPSRRAPKTRTTGATIGVPAAFDEVLHLIEVARHRAFQAANTELIDLYWNVGGYVSTKIAEQKWGKGTVEELSAYIQKRQPGIGGFSPQNIWRMRQFYEAYRDQPILSALLRELNWTCNMLILGKCKLPEEREFYLRVCQREGWASRDLDRQISTSLFARTVLHPPKLSTRLRELQPAAAEVFKDSYVLEFLGLPDDHSEADLHRSLLHHLRRFITELGRDFCFIGSEITLQVGGRDFSLDLLFFHRGMSCFVAFELKLDEFQPEHLGKLGFYLEALDRDVKKPHENPSIGVLLCASKDSEVVEPSGARQIRRRRTRRARRRPRQYALSRSLSPSLIAEYQTAAGKNVVRSESQLPSWYISCLFGNAETRSRIFCRDRLDADGPGEGGMDHRLG